MRHPRPGALPARGWFLFSKPAARDLPTQNDLFGLEDVEVASGALPILDENARPIGDFPRWLLELHLLMTKSPVEPELVVATDHHLLRAFHEPVPGPI